MFTAAENDRITRVGPGTPLGDTLRRYWHPIAPVARLDEHPVQKVRILGEDLVLYRDRSGTVGLVGQRCAHRLVSLEFGIPDTRGIRCPYHGWNYDETGQCIDTPLESPNSRLKDHVNIGGYPVQEMGGLIFAYLGPGPAPILPPWDFLVYPNALRQIGISIIPCNWLQCHENSGDPYHNVYLHGHLFKYELERKGLVDQRASDLEMHRSYSSMRLADGASHVVFEHDPHGFRKGILYSKERGAPEERVRWHAYNIFPYYSRSSGAFRTQINMRVPLDDTHTYHINYVLYHAPGVDAPSQDVVPYYNAPLFDEAGKPMLDYVLAQDMTAWWSQGDITDRTREHLGATDIAIVEQRKILEAQIRAVEEGRDPINVYRDPAAVGSFIELEPAIGKQSDTGVSGYRNLFHKGFYQDDADRYGPIIEQISDLMRAGEALASAKERDAMRKGEEIAR